MNKQLRWMSLLLGCAAVVAGLGVSSSAKASCWDGAWGGWVSESTPGTCVVSFFGEGLNAKVTNQVRWGFRWEKAVMQRTNNCTFGNTILWINTQEYNISTGGIFDWYWSTTPTTIKNCTFKLTRNAVPDNRRIQFSRCLMQACDTPQ